MKIDIDIITPKVVRFLLSLQKPFWIRAGNKGINLISDCQGCTQTNDCYACWVYSQFDDKRRLKINRRAFQIRMPNNILNDIKRGEKKPDIFHYIETELDISRFLDHNFTGFY